MISGIRKLAISSLFRRPSYFYGTTSRLFCDQNTTNKSDDVSESDEVVRQLKEENTKLQDIFKDTEDKYKRALAECENVRQRMLRQVEDAKQFGIHKFCKDLLDVADILTTATQTVNKEDLETNISLKQMYKGLQMTESQMLQVFARHGIERIQPSIGEKFDPNFHEALFQIPIPENKDKSEVMGTVAVCSKVGYKLHCKTLRPAAVGVYQ